MNRVLFSLSALLSLTLAASGESVRLEASAGQLGKKLPLGAGSSVTVSSMYSDEGYVLQFAGKGGPTAADVGGALTLQVRPGFRNAASDGAPVVVRFVFEGKKGTLADLCRGPQLRDTRRTVPTAVFEAKDGAWTLTFRAPWRGATDKLPFTGPGPRASTWRMTAVYRDAKGVETAFGTPAEPVVLAFAKPKPRLQAFPALIADKAVGAGLWDYYALWNWSWKEHWLGYPDAGVETFRWRDAESEKLFHTHVVEGIRREVEPDLAKIRTDRDDPERRVAEIVQRGTVEEKNGMFAKLARLSTLQDRLASARRDYFLDRFAGRTVPEPPPLEMKKRKSKDAVLPPAKIGAAESDDEAISLDD